jgi:uncharacterized protein YndB with AHSA1/START domain
MTEPTAEVSRVIDATPEAIFEQLTSAERMKDLFFGADVDSTFIVGDPITFAGVLNGRPYRDKGEILANDPPRRLAFSHFSPLGGKPDDPANYHTVTFDLIPAGAATEVTLTQANLLGGVSSSDVASRGEFEKNWRTLLEKLDDAVTGRGRRESAS